MVFRISIMKNKYDSSVVFLYATGREHLMPLAFRQQIPYSTICSWRQTDYTEYLGHEFRNFFEDSFTATELKYQVYHLKKTVKSIMRSWVALSHLIMPLIKNAGEDKQHQKQVLRAINFLRERFGLEKALKYMGISKTMYYQWELEARFECFDSYTQLCVKRHPHQLQLNEIQKIKKLLTDTQTDHWPICSIAGNALRKKQLVASLFSWYKYAKLWGVQKRPAKKQRKKVGLMAQYPNEYLHVDTTFYTLIDDRKVCISFVIDNFSKMILGYHVAGSNSFELVRHSMTKALKVIAKHPSQKKHSYMVTDGGKENHNKFIDAFISKLSKHKVTKIRALKDIRFSNSPVEAVHRTIKGRYLRNRKFESIKALDNYLKWAVEDYNMVRPHYKHRPRTPYEVYMDIPLDFDVRKRVKSAIKKRVKANKCTACLQCTGVCNQMAKKPQKGKG